MTDENVLPFRPRRRPEDKEETASREDQVQDPMKAEKDRIAKVFAAILEAT